MASPRRQITARNLVLDILRVAGESTPAPVGALVEIGKMFGFSSGSMRVTISRLVAANLLENDDRGWYRLALRTDPMNRLVESWRLGDDRMRPWTGGWWAVTYETPRRRPDKHSSERALRACGFRATLDRLWLRPDNLVVGRAEISSRLESLGLVGLVSVFTAAEFPDALVARWCSDHWKLDKLLELRKRTISSLAKSLERVEVMPLRQALVETFVHGGEAIHVLALDPLLPEQLSPGESRRELTALMLRYDEVGRVRWLEHIAESFPLHLQVMAGGRR